MKMILAILLAIAVNIGLLLLMDRMVSTDGATARKRVEGNIVEFIQPEMVTTPPETRRRSKPPPKPEAAEQPMELASSTPSVENVQPLPMEVQSFNIEGLSDLASGTGLGGTQLFHGNPESSGGTGYVMASDLTPISVVAPQYPAKARRAGIEGFCLVQFTVTERGTCTDPVVVDSDPPGVFDETATEIVKQWRFQPQIKGGEAVAITARYNFKFQLPKK